jgi:hypothetical protein
MPILPLDHPEPFSATLGVMLYPDEADAPKARAFAAQYLAGPIRRLHEAGGILPYDVLARILMDAGQPLTDFEERWWGGGATGEAFKAFFALANADPALASWNNAIKIVIRRVAMGDCCAIIIRGSQTLMALRPTEAL